MGGPGAWGGPGGAWRVLESAVGSSQAARAVWLSLWHRPASGTQALEEGDKLPGPGYQSHGLARLGRALSPGRCMWCLS